ncbi:acetoacetate--CoA ligase [Millisia brevis]|uniref:acetoacetate--CoA ligase n=1 Tax=Millisia brevis TaxID=264148 RepID=UPI000829A183|nr:acetoacetate--CoA ligase [Millisia brevis]
MTDTQSTTETEPVAQWTPGDVSGTRLADFARSVGHGDDSWSDLLRWSIEDIDGFWTAIWEYFGFPAGTRALPGEPPTEAMVDSARWFPGATVNYAASALNAGGSIVALDEDGSRRVLSADDIRESVAALAARLLDLGVGPGDRVVGYLPNIPEAAIALLATASIGAIWAGCGQDYAPAAAIDRLGQLEPVVLIAADGYRYGGKQHDKRSDLGVLRAGIPSLRATIVASRLGLEVDGAESWPAPGAQPAGEWPVPVPFDYPLWVVFSSGTTGKPKGIVHGHGGVILEHLKSLALQSDLSADDVFFWYTSPSWMMWNYQVSGLLVGARIITFDGSPAHPGLFDLAESEGVTFLGTSPGYVLSVRKAGATPNPGALRSIGVTGATLPPDSCAWLGEQLGVPVASLSGGTDVVSGFVGWTPWVPVWAGEISTALLGVDLRALGPNGTPVIGEVGELVIAKPMPSMPVHFWNDPDGARYRAAYFDDYPGYWRHGDWVTITDRGSVIMHGRSDSTLNRNGIRMGSADIYQVVEAFEEIAEALVLGIEDDAGGYWMPLFVVPAEGQEITEDLIDRLAAAIRVQASPRHVPDEVIVVSAIPHTRTGKKLEVPLKRLFQGGDQATVVDRTAIDSTEAFDEFVAIGERRRRG